MGTRGYGRYTKEDVETVLANLEKGATFTAACTAAGLSEHGMRKHMDSNPEVARRVEVARARPRQKVEHALFDAATTKDKHGRIDTRAAELYLTNCFPRDWKSRREVNVAVNTDDSEAVRRARMELTPEAIEAHQKVAHEEILRKGKEKDPNETVH